MSKDGHLMLYASFNDSLVEEMHISWFGEDNKDLYPDVRSLRYPKVSLSSSTFFFLVDIFEKLQFLFYIKIASAFEWRKNLNLT